MAVLKWFGICALIISGWVLIGLIIVAPPLIIPVFLIAAWNSDRIRKFLRSVEH